MLIVDTGVLVAAADRTDRPHAECVALEASWSGRMRTTVMVIAEASYLIERELGPAVERLLYDSIVAGAIIIEELTIADWERIGELVSVYDSLPLGGTDAGLIAIAERLGQERVATLDRRHFSVVRPRHVTAFELIP